MKAVDQFVIYDNIEFSKKGWINRNRILIHGKDSYITIPLKKDSDYLFIRDRCVADVWSVKRKIMLNRIIEAYRKSPHFNSVYPLVESIILYEEPNLFVFLLHSLNMVKEYLDIKTSFIVSSALPIDHELKSQSKVIKICKTMNANIYLNPIGGVELYKKEKFQEEGIELHFLKSNDIIYKQFNNTFVPRLSIIDIMMFNSKLMIHEYLQLSYSTI
jgi:hypothetical protein